MYECVPAFMYSHQMCDAPVKAKRYHWIYWPNLSLLSEYQVLLSKHWAFSPSQGFSFDSDFYWFL